MELPMKETIRKALFVLPTLVLLLSGTNVCEAQSTSGTISGMVLDERQSVISNATVTARNVGTNESRAANTDSNGRYRLPNMPVGQYEVSFQAGGFAKLVRSGIELLLNQEAVVDGQLKLSAVQEV